MNKKIVCLLLTICLLVPVLSTGAFAAKDYSPYYQEVEIASGDSVIALCKSLGMDFYKVKKAILIINGYATDDSLGVVKPGDKIYLPYSEAAADAIVTLYNTVVSAVIPASSVQTYTVKSGDTVFGICRTLGLDYKLCRDSILQLNGWASESKLSGIYAGQDIVFPVSDSAASEIIAIIAAANDANAGVLTNSGDEFVCYLASHIMLSGETVRSVCTELFGKYDSETAELVRSLNSLKDISRVKAGVSYLFPSVSADNAEYAVYSHRISSGDTVGDLCTAYGVTYAKVSDVLTALNPKINLRGIQAGLDILLVAPCKGASDSLVIKDVAAPAATPIPSAPAASGGASAATGTTVASPVTGVTAVIPTSSVTAYTVKAGDTVYSICSSMKLTYSVCASTILNLNGMTDLSGIYAGQSLILPVSDTAAEEINAAVSEASKLGSTGTTPAGDSVKCYLVSYTMSTGETAKNVCTSLGVNYDNNTIAVITGINGITDVTKMQAGRAYLFPTASAAGAAYTVYSHKVVAGDTLGNICSSYGVKYNEVSTVLAGLNPKAKLPAIQAGTELLIAVPSIANASPTITIK